MMPLYELKRRVKLKNEYIIYIVAAFIGLILGVGGFYYYKSNSQIQMTETQANVVLGAFYQSELCFRTGFHERTDKADLTDIVYRVKVPTMEDGYSIKDGMLKRDVLEAYIEDRLSQGLKGLSQPGAEEYVKGLCNSYVEKAANVKKQYK